jgi:hypothetical protein
MALVSKTFSQIITFTRASTATFFDSAGVLQSAAIDAPRFDYDPSTLAAQGLLIEEARTNLLLQSQDFATTWAASGTSPAVVTANTTTSLDGTVNADTVSGTGTNSDRVQQTVTVAASTTYVISFFVKNSTAVQSRFHVSNPNSGTTNSETNITWSGSAITGFINTGTTIGVAVAYPNNWWRVYFAFTTNASDAGTATVRFYPNSTGADATFKAVFLWGAQLEAGAFPTSYIPTTAAERTRERDVASVNTLSPWYNATEGTLYVQAQDMSDAAHATSQPRAVSINDNTTSNTIDVSRIPASAQVRARVDVATVNQFNSLTTAWPLATQAKVALAYKENDFAACLGGGSVSTDPLGTIPIVTRMAVGNITTGNGWVGWIQRITYYPRRLSDAELQAITA